MNRLYFSALISFFIFIFTINIITFFAGFNSSQLTNFKYLKERTVATYYLAKNIIFYTGINIKNINDDELNNIIDNVSMTYNIDKNILSSFINNKNQYTITTNGGMGLSSISSHFFNLTDFNDPFNPEENISATAITIINMINEGQSIHQIRNEFYGIKENVLSI